MNYMIKLEFFIFIFCILIFIKNIFNFIIILIQDNPKPIRYSNTELIVLGLSVSFILTYLFH